MTFLKCSAPGAAARLVELSKPVTLIGRDPDCDVVLDDPGASRRHCRIRRVGQGHVVEDLGSTNGTYVNGAAVSLWRLSGGDVIVVGNWNLVYGVKNE